MIRLHKIDLIYLLETRVKIHKADKVRSCIVPNWDYVYNYDQHTLGRIWICWKNTDFEVFVINKSDQSINCMVKFLKYNFCWYHSFVYGDNKGVDRKLLWTNLASVKASVGNNPWMICKDFNVVKFLIEKLGFDKLNSYEVEFGKCLNDLEVI